MAQSTPETADDAAEGKRSTEAATATREAPPAPPAGRGPCKVPLRQLPHYTRSLLRIKVPVVVILAEKRQPLGRIVEMGPGSLVQFDKSCEEMLRMSVGSRTVATGEAVKVGDKFGLRITSIVLPDERFQPVKPAAKHE